MFQRLLFAAAVCVSGGALGSSAATPIVEYTGDPEVRVDVVMDTRPASDCRQGSLPGARCLPAEDFLGPHNRLANFSGLLWLLGSGGLTGDEHVLVAGSSTGERDFVAGLLYLAGQRKISVLTRPLAAAPGGDGARPRRLRSKTREAVYQAQMRDDRVVLRGELASLLKSGNPPPLLDGRSEAEYWGQHVRSPRGGHLPGAQHLAAVTLLPAAPGIQPGLPGGTLAYAHDAYEGLAYLARLVANGIDARLYLGGWSDWASDGALPADLLTLPDTSIWRAQTRRALPVSDNGASRLLWGLLVDLRKLSQGGLPERQVQGLLSRSRGSIAALPLLLRLANQESGIPVAPFPAGALREQLGRLDLQPLLIRIAGLAERYPFDTLQILLPVQPGSKRPEIAAKQHRELCASCHDHGPADAERPAFNLFLQSRSMPAEEFAARMVAGIRGDRLTGLGNPFTDYELAALIALYTIAASVEPSE